MAEHPEPEPSSEAASPPTATPRRSPGRSRRPGKTDGSARARSTPPIPPVPCRRASTGWPSARSSTCSTCSRTRRGPASTSATRSATSAPTSSPLPADGGPQRAPHPRLRHVRPAGRAVRRPDRHPPADHDRGEHRHHRQAAAAHRPGPRSASGGVHHRPRLLPVDTVDLPADLRQPGTTTIRTAPDPSPSWRPSSTPGSASPPRARTPPPRPGPTSIPSPVAR